MLDMADFTARDITKTFYNILNVFGSAERFFNAVISGSDLLCEVPDKLLNSAKAYASKQYLAETLCLLNEKGHTCAHKAG